MGLNWDTLITATILIVMGLGFWAKLSRQTIPELLASIREAFTDGSEESIEYIDNRTILD